MPPRRVAGASAPPRSVSSPRRGDKPLSLKRVETVISRSVAVFGIVFGAQTLPSLLAQVDQAQPPWLMSVVPLLFGSLVVVLVLSFLGVLVRIVHGMFAAFYLVVLVSWPFFVAEGADVSADIHWLYYLLTVATAMAAIAFRPLIGIIYLVVAPLGYFVVRVTPLGGGATPQLAALESVYAIILGGAVVIIVTMLRQAASSVDTAQTTALDRYGHAVRQHATEVERVQVDSIVHDSVLTTLISAARAFSPPAQKLAATMAANAIGHLREAALTSPDDGTKIRMTTLADRIVAASAALSHPFDSHTNSVGTRSVPVQVAEAIYSASVQAMVNSLQHAGDRNLSRWVSVRGEGDAIEVIVGDTGDGFTLADVPNERLGVRVSIIERIANAGGQAVIETGPGRGTVVSIRWPIRDVPGGSQIPGDSQIPGESKFAEDADGVRSQE